MASPPLEEMVSQSLRRASVVCTAALSCSSASLEVGRAAAARAGWVGTVSMRVASVEANVEPQVARKRDRRMVS